jgi:hypothetical protein
MKGTTMTRKSPAKTTSRPSKRGDGKTRSPSKLDTLVTLLRNGTGATIDDLASATGWQKHSVRGALAGTLKKKGHSISSEVVDGARRYRIAETQA